jgi:uncharacterized membrane protein
MSQHSDAQPMPQILVGLSFDDPFRAQEFLTASTRLAAKGRMKLKDAVTVLKEPGGHTHVRETIDPQPGRTAMTGALWAGLFGLILGGPVGWVAGLAVGAAGGAATAKIVDLGITDEWVKWFEQAVQPGRATVVLLVEDLDKDALVGEARRFTGAELVYTNLDALTADRIEEALGTHVRYEHHDVPQPD